MTSGLDRKADNFRVGLHVSNVPDSDIAPKYVGSHAKRERCNAGN
jgi:hypothetical protein